MRWSMSWLKCSQSKTVNDTHQSPGGMEDRDKVGSGCLSFVYTRPPQGPQCCTFWDQDQHFSQALAGTAIPLLT